ncbi:hypothetical protein CEXT_142871 [Caerostris extrusa]|uniref:Uncharacterized protein n=1 Tax=Caerostris extrusa TaxID=172846 RepID=A0AAV4RWN4_CAEEX|nr:hypothetical protein CEXT_142871 [Caerostris extrusa]
MSLLISPFLAPPPRRKKRQSDSNPLSPIPVKGTSRFLSYVTPALQNLRWNTSVDAPPFLKPLHPPTTSRFKVESKLRFLKRQKTTFYSSVPVG